MSWIEFEKDFTALAALQKQLSPATAWKARFVGVWRDEAAEWEAEFPFSEPVRIRFELVATKAAIAIGITIRDVYPWRFWLDRLYLYLRDTKSQYLKFTTMDDGAVVARIYGPLEASSDYCASLECRRLERRVLGSQEALRLTILRDLESTHRQPEVTAQNAVLPVGKKLKGKHIAKQLEELRLECDLTQQQLADNVSGEVRTVQRHLSGESIPGARSLQRYSDYFSKRLNRQILIKKMS